MHDRGVRLKRSIPIDYLRSAVTVSVVAHHAALAYNTFSSYNPAAYMQSSAPVVDSVRFAFLDILVGWNDLFFMSLMFFVSGLFVAPSLAKKGARRFFTDRAKRLGIPFFVSALLLSPIAYYPSWLLSDSAPEGNYLARFFTIDGSPAGPAWFIWVLLAFCGVVALAYRCVPGLISKTSWSARSAGNLVAVFLTASLVTTIPMDLLDAVRWLHVAGPFTFPLSRCLIYFAWFFLGIALGSSDLECSLSRENLKYWPLWLVIGGFSYVAHGLVTVGSDANAPIWVVKVVPAVLFSLCCTFTCLAAVGLFQSRVRRNWATADHLSENAYGIYIFHYALVIWLQFALLSLPLPAAVKFMTTFSVALAGSWFMTAMARKTVAKTIL